MITSEEIKASLTKALHASFLETVDPTGEGVYWVLMVVNLACGAMGPVDQHRMVNDALKAEIGDQRIHALALKTFSPAQWEKLGS